MGAAPSHGITLGYVSGPFRTVDPWVAVMGRARTVRGTLAGRVTATIRPPSRFRRHRWRSVPRSCVPDISLATPVRIARSDRGHPRFLQNIIDQVGEATRPPTDVSGHAFKRLVVQRSPCVGATARGQIAEGEFLPHIAGLRHLAPNGAVYRESARPRSNHPKVSGKCQTHRDKLGGSLHDKSY